MLSSCDRISIGGKSPLTGGVKEANAGGTTGLKLTFLGIKALIIEDKPADSHWNILFLNRDGVKFDQADDYVGLGVYDTTKNIRKIWRNVAIALIGQVGKMQLLSAGIENLDKENNPSRIAARGGLGGDGIKENQSYYY
jgi:aldehyde:ferredoxin oxidoreductase